MADQTWFRGNLHTHTTESDDSHDYYDFSPDKDNPGRGWVMVEAEALESDAVVEAMASGRFYSSTGVFLGGLTSSADEVSLKIRQRGASPFLTRFIGREVAYRPTGDEGYIRAHVMSSDGWQAWTQPVFLT